MKLLCLTTRGLDKASTQYRFVQFTEFFQESGVVVEFLSREALNTARMESLASYDAVINQRCLLPLGQARAVARRARHLLLDFDDAIFTRPGRPRSWLAALRVRWRLRYLLTHADLTTVANGYLADYARRHAKRVEIVPMALDAQTWHPGEPREGHGPVRFGWAGSPSNLPQLERLGSVLGPWLQGRPNVRLVILSGQRPELPFDFDYLPFTPGAEPDFVRSLDVGLLALQKDAFTQGKSPIKALQYMSCAVPALGEIFGGAAEMLDETNSIAVERLADWPRALEALASDPERRRRLGKAGLERFRKRHELRVVGARWLELFRGG